MKQLIIPQAQGKSQNGVLALRGDLAHYLAHVRRVKVGDRLVLYVELEKKHVRAEVVRVHVETVELALLENLPPLRPAFSDVELRLFLSLTKIDALNLVLRAAVECGVSRITLGHTQHSVVHWSEGIWQNKKQRWMKILQQAGNQSGNAALPQLDYYQNLWEAPFEGFCILAYEKALSSEKPFEEQLKNLEHRQICNIFIGPEGGFSPKEVEEASSRGFIPLCFPTYTLRAETAAIYSLGYVYAWMEKFL